MMSAVATDSINVEVHLQREPISAVLEPHFAPAEIAERLHVSEQTVMRMFPKPAAIASALARVNSDFIACMEWKTQSTMRMRKLIKSRQKDHHQSSNCHIQRFAALESVFQAIPLRSRVLPIYLKL